MSEGAEIKALFTGDAGGLLEALVVAKLITYLAAEDFFSFRCASKRLFITSSSKTVDLLLIEDSSPSSCSSCDDPPTCVECFKSCCSFCGGFCESCERFICDSCGPTSDCFLCGQTICTGKLGISPGCRGENMDKEFWHCGYDCCVCRTTFCLECRGDEEINMCDFCEDYACSDCREVFACNSCGKSFCENCVTTCERCGCDEVYCRFGRCSCSCLKRQKTLTSQDAGGKAVGKM